jgi:hypothetical protein
MTTIDINSPQREASKASLENARPIQRRGPPQKPDSFVEATLPRWLTVDQIRKMQRMRREAVLTAMLSGELPFEQRGRIRYARLTDVLEWEQRRLTKTEEPVRGLVHPELLDFA